MDADEQIGLYPLRFLHPHMQRHKKVRIARQISPHGITFDGCGVDELAQFKRNFQHDIFLARALRAYGAGVFATMAWIQRNDDQAIGFRRLATSHRGWLTRCAASS